MLKESRKELAELLGAIPFLPERINPPVTLISPAYPYVVIETSTDYVANYAITVVVARQESELANDALDDQIEYVLDHLPSDATLNDVEVPFLLEWNNGTYLATKINIERPL